MKRYNVGCIGFDSAQVCESPTGEWCRVDGVAEILRNFARFEIERDAWKARCELAEYELREEKRGFETENARLRLENVELKRRLTLFLPGAPP